LNELTAFVFSNKFALRHYLKNVTTSKTETLIAI